MSRSCFHCGHLLANISPELIDHESPGLISQTVIQSWFGYPLETSRFADLLLPNTSSRVLFALISGIYQAISYHEEGDMRLESAESRDKRNYEVNIATSSAEEKLARLTTSFNALTNWPSRFLEFLEKYRSRVEFQSYGGVRTDFPYLYDTLIESRWRYPEFDFVQQVFEDFLVQNYQHVQSIENTHRYRENEAFQSRFPNVSITQAAKMLNATESDVFEMISRRILWRRRTSDNTQTNPPWIPRYEVQFLLHEWERKYTLASAAERLGTTEAVVRRLVELKLIHVDFQVNEPEVNSYVINGQNFHRFLLLLWASIQSVNGASCSLKEAVKRLSNFGFDDAKIIEAIIKKELRAQNGLNIGSLEIQISDVETLWENHISKLALEILAPIAKKRGVQPTALRTWLKEGLIQIEKGENLDFFITEDEWKRFNDAYMSASQAAELLGVAFSTFETWVKRGRYREVGWKEHRVHTNLFRREEVEKFAPGNCLRRREILREYRININQFENWILQGRLTPISGPGVDKAHYYLYARADIERILTSEDLKVDPKSNPAKLP
jgi:hypothetical protein